MEDFIIFCQILTPSLLLTMMEILGRLQRLLQLSRHSRQRDVLSPPRQIPLPKSDNMKNLFGAISPGSRGLKGLEILIPGPGSMGTISRKATTGSGEQAIANGFIKNFDKKHFQRLLMEWIVEANLSFETAEHDKLRKIFAYLNPCVKLCDANLSATSIRRKIVASYE
ncbi:hypothetical protein HZ326_22422, partial [Fusarium oxysporum f. sp. albedinis]